MGRNVGGSIIRDGLVVYLDPANQDSYYGSGNWLDLTNSINAIPVLSPTYLNQNYGILDLDPGDYYTLDLVNGVRYEDSTEFTVSMWYYHDSSTGGTGGNARQYLWDSRPAGGSSKVYAMWIDNGIDTLSVYLGTIQLDVTRPPLTQWNYVTFTMYRTAPTNYIKFYLDGQYVDETTGTASTGNQTTPGGYIGTAYVSGYNFDGKLGPFMIYNRVLSQPEILQNYNIFKHRYQ